MKSRNAISLSILVEELIKHLRTGQEDKIIILNSLVVPVLLYGNVSWVPSKKHHNQIRVPGMKFLKQSNGCSLLGKIRN